MTEKKKKDVQAEINVTSEQITDVAVGINQLMIEQFPSDVSSGIAALAMGAATFLDVYCQTHLKSPNLPEFRAYFCRLLLGHSRLELSAEDIRKMVDEIAREKRVQ